MRAPSTMALLMVMLMASAPLSGCFGEERGDPSSTNLSVNPEVLIAGVFQEVELSATEGMSVYVPYLIKDPGSGFVQNTTVVDISRGDTVVLEVLVPPRTDGIFVLIGEYGRGHWPVRHESESWETWLSRGGAEGMDGHGAIRVPANNSTLDSMEVHSAVMGGPVSVKFTPSIRESSFCLLYTSPSPRD